LFPNSESPEVEKLGLCIPTLGIIKPAEVVETLRHFRMLRPQYFLTDGQRLLVEYFCLIILPLIKVQVC